MTNPDDINHASLERIHAALPRSPVIASRIIADRDAHGAFSSYHDLQRRVRGLGPVKIDLLMKDGLVIQIHQSGDDEETTTSEEAEPEVDTIIAPVGEEKRSGADDVAVEPVSPGIASDVHSAAILPASPMMLLPNPSTPPPAPPAESMAPSTPPRTPMRKPVEETPPPSCCAAWFSCCLPSPALSHHDAVAPAAAVAPAQEPIVVQTTTTRPSAIDPIVEVEVQLSALEITSTPQPISSVADPLPLLTPVPSVPPSLVDLSPPPPPPSSIRAASWNLCNFGSYKAANASTMSIIADVILRARFDVVTLQEVRDREACEMLVDQYLNNPQRVTPAVHADAGIEPPPNDSTGHWRLVISDYVEYGTDSVDETGKDTQPQQQPEVIPEADIVEESIPTDAPAAITSDDEQVLTSQLAQLSVSAGATEVTTIVLVDAALVAASSSSSSTAAAFTTPTKKQPGSRAASPWWSSHHHHGSSGSGSGGGWWHKGPTREYYAFVYRSDRVQMPDGCRLYQTKAATTATATATADSSSTPPPPPAVPETIPETSVGVVDPSSTPSPVDADATTSSSPTPYTWWRSPCSALVQPVVSSDDAADPSAAPPLSWLLTALHVHFGTGLNDSLAESRYLQQLYAANVHSLPTDQNAAVALLGDFNAPYHIEEFHSQCLPKDKYQPLVLRPHTSTFSAKREDCNLYDQVFVERAIHDAVWRDSTAAAGPTPMTPLASGVIYFDRAYFPSSRGTDAASLNAANVCRAAAKRIVSDHRPVFADLPSTGDVRRVPRPDPNVVPIPRTTTTRHRKRSSNGSGVVVSPPRAATATSTNPPPNTQAFIAPELTH